MESVRQKIENPTGLLASYKAASNIGAGAFVPSAGLVALEEGDIRRAGNQAGNHEKIYNIIKTRFHKSGFIALLFDDGPQSREVLDVLAINVGLKGNAPLALDVISAMRNLFMRVVELAAMGDRPNTFAALLNIFRECKKIHIDGDFYKMAAIALAQYMLTNPCFTASRWTNDISIPKTWMLLLMEARVFIGSLSDADDRKRVLGVFQQAIKAQEEKFVEAVEGHPKILKIKSAEKRAKNVARFKLTLANCGELFDSIEPLVDGEDEDASLEEGRDRSFSVTSRASSVGDLNGSLKGDYKQANSDSKAFDGAKATFKRLLQTIEGGGVVGSDYIIATVDGLLRQPLLTQVQSMSKSHFFRENVSTMFGGNKTLRMAHPSLVWVQLVTYARLLAEKNVQSTACLKSLYGAVGEMADVKGWGQVAGHFDSLQHDLKKMPLLQLEQDDDDDAEALFQPPVFKFGLENASTAAGTGGVIKNDYDMFKL
jgi:hypothetical protein